MFLLSQVPLYTDRCQVAALVPLHAPTETLLPNLLAPEEYEENSCSWEYAVTTWQWTTHTLRLGFRGSELGVRWYRGFSLTRTPPPPGTTTGP